MSSFDFSYEENNRSQNDESDFSNSPHYMIIRWFGNSRLNTLSRRVFQGVGRNEKIQLPAPAPPRFAGRHPGRRPFSHLQITSPVSIIAPRRRFHAAHGVSIVARDAQRPFDRRLGDVTYRRSES